MAIFDDGPFLPSSSNNKGEHKGNFFEQELNPRKSFATIRMTPSAMDLIGALKDAAASFEVGLRAISDQKPGALDDVLERYGEMTRAEGALVRYLGKLMDIADHPELEKRRLVQVRY